MRTLTVCVPAPMEQRTTNGKSCHPISPALVHCLVFRHEKTRFQHLISHGNCHHHPSSTRVSCPPHRVVSTRRQEPQCGGFTQTPTQRPSSYEQKAIPSGKRRAPVAHAVLTPPVPTACLTAVPPVPAPAAVATLPVSTSAPTASPPVPVPLPTAATGARRY